MYLQRPCFFGDMGFWEDSVWHFIAEELFFVWEVGLRDNIMEIISRFIMNNRDDQWNLELESSDQFSVKSLHSFLH
jgi:hypothetical protein